MARPFVFGDDRGRTNSSDTGKPRPPIDLRTCIRAVALTLLLGACSYTVMPNLTGSVADAETLRPISGAIVDVLGREGRKASVVTDSDGKFTVPGEIGFGAVPYPRMVPTISIRIHAEGYQAAELNGPLGYAAPLARPILLAPDVTIP